MSKSSIVKCEYLRPSVLTLHWFDTIVCNFALWHVRWTAEPRHSEHEHFIGRRRVADEDDTVLDDAHESSSVASQDRGHFHHFILCAIKLSSVLVCCGWGTGRASSLQEGCITYPWRFSRGTHERRNSGHPATPGSTGKWLLRWRVFFL